MNGIDNTNVVNNLKNYIYQLGAFRHNFNSLELHLRIYLNKINGNNGIHVNKYLNLPLNSECDENAITDYKSFGDLCKGFNNYQDNGNKIDFEELINLRDALAHGRVSGDNMGNMTVIKYSRAQDGKVKVIYKSILSINEMEKIVKNIGDIMMEISIRGGAKVENLIN